MTVHRISRTTLVAVLVATTTALIFRSWLQVSLVQRGLDSTLAADLSYLVAPPVLAILLFPLWSTEKQFLADQFRCTDLSWRLALQALAIGVLLRLAWWSQLVAGVAFGVYSAGETATTVGPSFSFQCAEPAVVLLGFVVMAVLVPVIEEVAHRAYVQSYLAHRGAVFAVTISALIFTIFHRPDSWMLVFFAGLIFGALYWLTKSLWASLIVHATYNGLIQIDWRCLTGRWNPSSDDIPLMFPGIVATAAMVMILTALAALFLKIATGAQSAPR